MCARQAALVAVMALGVGLGCGNDSGGGAGSGGGAEKPKVAVSIFPLYDVARRVAGDRLEVVLVLPPGRSEHGYDPSPREVARLSDARMGVAVGLEMDAWLERIIRGAAGNQVQIVRVGERVEPRRMTAQEVGVEAAEEEGHEGHEGHGDEHGAHGEHGNEHGEHGDEHGEHGEEHGEHGEEHEEHGHEGHEHGVGSIDPHFWLDPVRMQGAVDVLVEAFGRLDAAGAAGFRQRGDEVKRQLAALHTELEGRTRALTKRTFVTFHASFGYFADRYDLRIAAVVEPFPGREPTARYVRDVVEAIRRSGAAALFSEPQLDPRPGRLIAQQSGVPIHELDPVGGTTGRDSYERLMRHDVTVMERALR